MNSTMTISVGKLIFDYDKLIRGMVSFRFRRFYISFAVFYNRIFGAENIVKPTTKQRFLSRTHCELLSFNKKNFIKAFYHDDSVKCWLRFHYRKYDIENSEYYGITSVFLFQIHFFLDNASEICLHLLNN